MPAPAAEFFGVSLSNVNVIPFGISDKPERRAFVLEAQNLGASHFGDVSDSGVQLVRL